MTDVALRIEASPRHPLAPLWARAFSSIKCIHMLHRLDRRALMQAAVAAHGMSLDVHAVTRHPSGDGRRGCYESHVAVMAAALAAGAERVLVFEDDAVGSPAMRDARRGPAALAEAVAFMDARDDWDLFFLGSFPTIWDGTIQRVGGSNVYKAHTTLSHAYVAHARFMRRMVARPYDGTPVDEVFEAEAASYAIYPSLFDQATTRSDITGAAAEVPFKATLFRAVEWYAWHVNVPLKLVLARLGLVVLLAILLTVAMRRRRRRLQLADGAAAATTGSRRTASS